jgi:hypothetical protein
VRDPRGEPIAQVLIGEHSLSDVLTDAPQPPRFRWARRVLAVLLAWAGVAWLLPYRFRGDRVLSLATAVVPLAVLAAVCWFDVRAVSTTILVALAILAAVLAGWRARSDLREG